MKRYQRSHRPHLRKRSAAGPGRIVSAPAGATSEPAMPLAGDVSRQQGGESGRGAYEWLEAFDQVAEPIFVHDKEFRILRCNAAYAACAQQPIEAIIGKPYWQVFPKSSGPMPGDAEALGKQAEVKSEFTTKSGEVFLTWDITAHKEGGEFWYSKHRMENITARKLQEEAEKSRTSEVKQLASDLMREKAISDTIIESAPGAFFMIDEQDNLVRWNRYLSQETGLSDAELRGSSMLRTIYEEDRPLAAAKFLAAFATGYAHMEVRMPSVNRGIRQFLNTARRFEVDGVPFLAGYCIDVTDRKQTEDALVKEKAFFDALIESVPGAFYVLDKEGAYFRWNDHLKKLTGLSDRELRQRPVLLTIEEQDRPLAATAMKNAFETGYGQAELHVITHDRGVRLYFMTGRRFQVADETYLVGVGIDTTEWFVKLKELEHGAWTDPLTQVANRGHFLDMARLEFARCRRYGHPLSLWMLDIDHFKAVNDAYGHHAGDTALQSLVSTSRKALRDWDILGRVGGEEFAVLLPETEAGQALLVAERLRQAVATAGVPVEDGKAVHLTVSIGIATAHDADADVDTLLDRADRALYQAKRTGRDKVWVAETLAAA